MRFVRVITIFIFILPLSTYAQEISLFQQFNGRYDYTAIGNTLNQDENNLDGSFCEILGQSTATLNLEENQVPVAAYLYWAGSGTADTDVLINDQLITAEEQYSVSFNSSSGELVYFSCFTDVTQLISISGNGDYTLSGIDISQALDENPGYCDTRTNFAGWSIYIIYQDINLPLNQVSLFQGLEIINTNVTEKTIELENINVLDNLGAKIGFLAWEGDDALNFGESLSINDNILSNPPLNLSDNAFNGTNTFTNATDFFNADLDVYDVQDNISIGDTSATIKLTTGDFDSNGNFRADLIILNNIITVLNSQLPDATIVLNSIELECNSNFVTLEYTVFNTNSTDNLPEGTAIAFYLDGVLAGQSQTEAEIPIGEGEMGNIVLSFEAMPGSILELIAVVDDDGTGQGNVNETDETNNEDIAVIEVLLSEPTIQLPPLAECDKGFNSSTFDLLRELDAIDESYDLSAAEFYTSETDAIQEQNPVLNPGNYLNMTTPEEIFIRIPSPPCYQLFRFDLLIENCPPIVPEGFSPNEDGFNDWFNIQGLYDIFDQHRLLIYNRYGTLIFEGNNNLRWYGRSNKGLNDRGKLVPVGTYFYVLHLNDPDYQPLSGWVYLNY